MKTSEANKTTIIAPLVLENTELLVASEGSKLEMNISKNEENYSLSLQYIYHLQLVIALPFLSTNTMPPDVTEKNLAWLPFMASSYCDTSRRFLRADSPHLKHLGSFEALVQTNTSH